MKTALILCVLMTNSALAGVGSSTGVVGGEPHTEVGTVQDLAKRIGVKQGTAPKKNPDAGWEFVPKGKPAPLNYGTLITKEKEKENGTDKK